MTAPQLANKYTLGPRIGSGSFGEVYLCHLCTSSAPSSKLYAAKKVNSFSLSRHQQLLSESRILKNLIGVSGFPQIYWFGTENKARYMVMDLLGPSLEDLFYMCNKRLSLKTVLMLADQMLQRLEYMHSLGYTHRDIKPENFLMGISEESHILHLVDFGLSRKYRDAKTHQHIVYKENRSMTGTVRYASINTHFGVEQSRRDDLESIGYMLVYLAKGKLPWQGIKCNNREEKYKKIQERKTNTPIEIQALGLPIEFMTYQNYCRSLKFEEKPDYKFLRKLFRELFIRMGYMLDYSYDWCEFETMREIKTGQLEIRVEKKGERVRLDCREEIKEGGMMRIEEEEKEKEDDERWEKWEIPGSGEGSVEEDESKMGLRTGERAMEMKEFPEEW